MASYPGSLFSPATRQTGQTIQTAWFNDPSNEIVALEDAVLNGFAHAITISTGGLTVSTGSVNIGGPSTLATLSAGRSTLAGLSVSSGSTFVGPVTFSTTVTFGVTPTFSGMSLSSNLQVDGTSTFTGQITVSSLADIAILKSGQTRLGISTGSLSGGSTRFDNWNPTGLSTSSYIFCEPNGTNVSITGITGGVNGRVLWLRAAGSGVITLANEDANSSADCRIVGPGAPSGASTTIPAHTMRMLVYEGARWRVHGIS